MIIVAVVLAALVSTQSPRVASPSEAPATAMAEGQRLLAQGHAQQARQRLEPLAEKADHDYRVDLYLGDAAAMLGDDAAAWTHYEAFLHRAPASDPVALAQVVAVEHKVERLKPSVLAGEALPLKVNPPPPEMLQAPAARPPPARSAASPEDRTRQADLEIALGKQALHDDLLIVAMGHFRRAAKLNPHDPKARWILEYCQTKLWDERAVAQPFTNNPFQWGGPYGYQGAPGTGPMGYSPYAGYYPGYVGGGYQGGNGSTFPPGDDSFDTDSVGDDMGHWDSPVQR